MITDYARLHDLSDPSSTSLPTFIYPIKLKSLLTYLTILYNYTPWNILFTIVPIVTFKAYLMSDCKIFFTSPKIFICCWKLSNLTQHIFTTLILQKQHLLSLTSRTVEIQLWLLWYGEGSLFYNCNNDIKVFLTIVIFYGFSWQNCHIAKHFFYFW